MQVEGGTQRDAGDDARQRDRQDEQERDRFAAEEPRARQRRRRRACRAASASAVDTIATRIDSASACQMSGRPQATPNQLKVRPGGGNSKLLSSVLKA